MNHVNLPTCSWWFFVSWHQLASVYLNRMLKATAFCLFIASARNEIKLVLASVSFSVAVNATTHAASKWWVVVSCLGRAEVILPLEFLRCHVAPDVVIQLCPSIKFGGMQTPTPMLVRKPFQFSCSSSSSFLVLCHEESPHCWRSEVDTDSV